MSDSYNLTEGPRLVTEHWLYRTPHYFVVKRCHKNVRMTSVSFKMADLNAGYLKVKLDLLKRWHLKYATKRILHTFVNRIDKFVPRITVWHHEAFKH